MQVNFQPVNLQERKVKNYTSFLISTSDEAMRSIVSPLHKPGRIKLGRRVVNLHLMRTRARVASSIKSVLSYAKKNEGLAEDFS